MYKIFIFICLALLPVFGFTPVPQRQTCTCPAMANVHKTGQTEQSFTYAWDEAYSGAQYKVWYIRREDSYSSGYFYTYNTAYTFAGLDAGRYTFFVQTVCGGELSSYSGVEDTIGA